jgi:PiT family inorganic phosphate transporter
MTVTLVLIVVFALFFDMANGWNDAANAIATVVATRVLKPWHALAFGASLNFVGALFSSEVARTVGQDIASPEALSSTTFLAAVIAAPLWIGWCTWRGLPISASHSLMGALVGAVIASAGVGSLEGAGIRKIVFGIFTSPIIGFVLGFLILVTVAWTFRRVRPRTADRVFGKLQLISAGAMAFAHGTGDAQKAMGIITGAMVSAGVLALPADGRMDIPLWVRLASASFMALGTAMGGWGVMKTLGSRLATLRPYQGFAAETAAATTILANTLTGVPVSTTHSITGAIMGVGATRGMRRVKWAVGKKIVFAWVFTFPVCIGSGALVLWLLHALGVR